MRGLKKLFYNLTMSKKVIDMINDNKILTAKLLIQTMKSFGNASSRDVEFKVFSQFGDDGIIQYLINNIDVGSETFVEFGVENYLEANTRFLLINNNWRGLVIDGNREDVEYIKNDEIYWRYDLTAVNSFITSDNINHLLADHGFSGELGILSIDIDGNDYWVWQSIQEVSPAIVIIEYNSVFGPDHAITVPYTPEFQRTLAHYSNLYWGSSLKALTSLAQEKNYFFWGCNSNGNNAYFIRQDKIGSFKVSTPELGFVDSRFRESRNRHGQLTFLRGTERLKIIGDMPVFDIEKRKIVKIKDLFKLTDNSSGLRLESSI
jgi:hypothetical protein